MHKNLLRIGFFAAICLTSSMASAACYNVYNSKGRLVARTPNPPVNMGKHLRYSVPPKYGRGSTMVFEAPRGTPCNDYSAANDRRGTRTIQDTNAILENLNRLHNVGRTQ